MSTFSCPENCLSWRCQNLPQSRLRGGSPLEVCEQVFFRAGFDPKWHLVCKEQSQDLLLRDVLLQLRDVLPQSLLVAEGGQHVRWQGDCSSRGVSLETRWGFMFLAEHHFSIHSLKGSLDSRSSSERPAASSQPLQPWTLTALTSDLAKTLGSWSETYLWDFGLVIRGYLSHVIVVGVDQMNWPDRRMQDERVTFLFAKVRVLNIYLRICPSVNRSNYLSIPIFSISIISISISLPLSLSAYLSTYLSIIRLKGPIVP